MKKLSELPIDQRLGQLLVKRDSIDWVLGRVITVWPNGEVEVEFVDEYPYTGQADQFTLAEQYHTWGRIVPSVY